jgi:hypothetical protein
LGGLGGFGAGLAFFAELGARFWDISRQPFPSVTGATWFAFEYAGAQLLVWQVPVTGMTPPV